MALAPAEDEFGAFGEDADFVPTLHLIGCHQAIQWILEFAGQNVLEVRSAVFGIVPVVEEQRFGPRRKLHLKGRGGVMAENLAGPVEFEIQYFLQIGRAKRMVNNGLLDAAQELRREVTLEGAHGDAFEVPGLGVLLVQLRDESGGRSGPQAFFSNRCCW